MNEQYFLGEGRFTQRDSVVRRALEEALSFDGRMSSHGKISLFLEKKLFMNKPVNMEEFRRRTASEIIQSGKSNGCSDYGIVFVALAREAGIPTRYVETFEEQNLLTLPIKIDGHVFAEIFLCDSWKIYEPKEGFKLGYTLAGRKYIPVARGLDFSKLFLEDGTEITLDSLDKLREFRNSFSKLYS